jgi:LPS O-antigen subunit length determinant protein (WzzB/FepE family)
VENNEFDLVESTRIIWKRRNIIILITVLFVVISSIVSFILPSEYEITTVIEPGTRPIQDSNGQIIEEKPFESPDSIKENILTGAFDREIKGKFNLTENQYPEVKAFVPKNTNLVVISTVSKNPQLSVQLLSEMNRLISMDINRKIEVEKETIESEIKMAEISKAAFIEIGSLVTNQIKNIVSKIDALEKNRNRAFASSPDEAMSVLLYSNEIQDQQKYLHVLEEKLANAQTQRDTEVVKIEHLRVKLSQIKSTITRKEPFVPEKPVSPRKALIISVFSLLGLLGSIMFVFILEIYKRQFALRNTESCVP